MQAISTIVYIADALGLLQYDAQTGVSSRFAASSQVWPPQTPGGVELGSPYALAVGGGVAGLFYTDLRTDSVHRWSSELVDYVSGVPREDAVLGDGWMTSTLHGPMGIALDVHGRLFVADSGHKRVVQITGFDRDTGFVEQPLALLQLPPKRAEYRILVIGNSFVWFDSTGRDSIGALVEKMLRDDNALKSIKQTPKVVSFHTVESISAQASLVKEIVSKSSFDFVIIIANANDFFGAPDLTAQLDLWHKEEADTVEALKAASIQSMFVLIPEHWMVTPLEVLYAREAIEPVDSDYASFEQPMLAQLQGIAPVLNLFPDIRAYEAAAFVKPLYANADLHPSLAGRAFIAQHIVKRLEELKPWSRSHR
ncbi:MAG: hypothetical protein JOZ59_01890 [Candidatus Eremiobacteraeota bacterium]|nr:hypothetical protein [Candidatus Eremiobacteraeota bacterium]